MTTNDTSLPPEALGSRLDDPTTTIVDVRPLPAYNGWRLRGEPRGGHVPGATSFPIAWLDRVDDDEIRRVLEAKGITADRSVVAYGDGTLRWHRVEDGAELLALFPLPDGAN